MQKMTLFDERSVHLQPSLILQGSSDSGRCCERNSNAMY